MSFPFLTSSCLRQSLYLPPPPRLIFWRVSFSEIPENNGFYCPIEFASFCLPPQDSLSLFPDLPHEHRDDPSPGVELSSTLEGTTTSPGVTPGPARTCARLPDDDHACVFAGLTSLHFPAASGPGAPAHFTAQRAPCSIESQAVVMRGVVSGPPVRLQSPEGDGAKGAGFGVLRKEGQMSPLVFMGGALTAVQETVQCSDWDAVVKPAKLLPGAGSDSTREPVYLITRLGTWGR